MRILLINLAGCTMINAGDRVLYVPCYTKGLDIRPRTSAVPDQCRRMTGVLVILTGAFTSLVTLGKLSPVTSDVLHNMKYLRRRTLGRSETLV